MGEAVDRLVALTRSGRDGDGDGILNESKKKSGGKASKGKFKTKPRESGGFIGGGDPKKYSDEELKDQYTVLMSDFGTDYDDSEKAVIAEYNRRFGKKK